MANISSKTRQLGLIGDPVTHSLSPFLHNFLSDRLGLDYVYMAYRVESENLKEAVLGARALGFRGFNVTLPYKREISPFMDQLSPAAEITGAINTVVAQSSGSLAGHNTDVSGFTRAANRTEYPIENSSCLVFGAGGAAAAVAYGLTRLQADKITICNRTLSKAEQLAHNIGRRTRIEEVRAIGLTSQATDKRVRNANVVINATSVGMVPDEAETIWKDEQAFDSNQLVIDLVYTPSPTKFMNLAASQGAQVLGGLDMLVCQALDSVELWTETQFDTEVAFSESRRRFREELE